MDNYFRIKKPRDSAPKPQNFLGGTLDSIHQTVVSEIKNINTKDLKARKAALEKEIESSQTHTYSKLQHELNSINKQLSQENPLVDYYTKNSDIILKYYSSTDNQQIQSSPSDQTTFMKYLTPNVVHTPSISKKELYEEYTSRMKLNSFNEQEEKTCVTEHCFQCNVPREELAEEGILVCPKCGSEEHMLVVSDFPSFRDPPKERNNYAYKKINHLNEILNQFQAKESTIVPEDVINEVICEINKLRIKNIAELTDVEIRSILKKLNRSKYYEHATHILSRLNGNPPPTITPEIEEKVRTMFQEIQAPFLMYCPDERTNFLSYSYILYKFFELLELDEYKVYFPLLKSRDRLITHDHIWKKMCDYLRWEFIRSV